jgi:hypothetical protein
MKKFNTLGIYLIAYLCLVEVAQTQTPSDALMMKQREFCFATTYEQGSWSQYWEGKQLRTNATIATLSRYSINPMIAIGLTDKLNLIAMASYVATQSSEPNGGKFEGVKGLQDFGLSLKYELLRKKTEKGELILLTNLNFSAPMSNYLSDYMPYSIGSGTKNINLRGIVQYDFKSGLYLRSAFAYLRRGQTEAERNYYYANGSYYTSWMDVPDAWNYHGILGALLFDNSLRLEASYMGLKSTTGDDIRSYNAGQPTNKVNLDQVGFFAQYYFKKVKGLGAVGSYTQIINGRNTGKFRSFNLGFTYQFKI